MNDDTHPTERPWMAEAASEGEPSYRDIFDATSDGLVIHDENGRILFVNKRMSEMSGFSAQEFLQLSVGDLSLDQPPYTQAEAIKHIQHALEVGPCVFPWRNKRRNGELFWTEVALRTCTIAGKKRIIASVRDVDDRRAAEEALRTSEARLSKIFHSSSNGMAFSEFEGGKIIDVNTTWMRSTGIPREAAVGKTGLELGRWADPANHEACMAELKRMGRVHDYEAVMVLKSKQRANLISAELIEIGDTRYVLWEFRDIHERKRADEALRESEEKFSKAFHSNPVGMTLSTKMDGRYLDVNAAFLDLLQRSREEVIGHTAVEMGVWADSEQRAAFLSTVKADGRAHNVEVTWNTKSGQTRDVVMSGEGVIVAGVECLLGSVLDISDRKRAEKKLQDSEEFKEAILNSVASQIAVLECRGIILAVNAQWQRFALDNPSRNGEPARNVGIGANYLEVCRTSFGESAEGALTAFEGILAVIEGRKASFSMEYPCHSPQERRWFSMNVTPLGKEKAVVVSHTNITERKESERRVLQLNRVLTLLSEINQCIVREKDAKAVLAAGCRMAVEKGEFRMAWIGMIDATTHKLEPVASAGLVEGYIDSLKIDLCDKSSLSGPAGQCLLSGKPLICADIEHDPDYLPWRDEALRRGYRSSGAFPLKVDGETVGVFSLYADTPQFFNEEEVRLLDEMAMDIGFAMEVSNREKERQRVAEELRATQERYKVLFESAPDAVFLIAAEGADKGRILAANDLAARSHGYLPEELVGKGIWDIDTPESAAKTPERLQRIIAGDLVTFEVEHRRKDGTTFPVEVTARQIVVDGRVCVLAFDRDISERKQREEALARLAKVVEQASETIIVTDTHGAILYVNPAFEKTSGYTCAEAIGQNPRLLKSGKHGADFYRQMWGVVARGEVWQGHFVNRRKDGTLFEEDATISPVRDVAGKIVSYVAVMRDVTQQVQLERQYLQAQKMESVGQLAGGVAHDFNNMLAATMMHLSLLKEKKDLGPETLETIEELIEEASRAANLTRQLLLFSRRSVMEVKLLDLNELVTNISKMLGRLIGEHIKVRFGHREGLPALECDAGMVEQVIMNLAVNARDAMPNGGKLSIGIEAVEADAARIKGKPDVQAGQFLCLSVADTGCGMDEATRQRIFEPFFTTKEPGKGTGLGLATVHGIVAQHKGWVEVESEVGKGTIFKVFLPASTKKITGATPVAKAAAMRGHETILVVEDEEAVRRLVALNLRKLGYGVFEAENGQAAMNLWQQRRGEFDLLFSDMVMPEGLTGLDLAEKLKKEKPGIKVIISSGYSSEIAGQSRLAAHGIIYLQKPYRVEILAKTVRDCLDGKC